MTEKLHADELWEKYIAYYKEKSGNAIRNGELLIESIEAREEILRRLKDYDEGLNLQEKQEKMKLYEVHNVLKDGRIVIITSNLKKTIEKIYLHFEEKDLKSIKGLRHAIVFKDEILYMDTDEILKYSNLISSETCVIVEHELKDGYFLNCWGCK